MSVQFTNTLIDQIIKGRCAEYADLMGLHKTGNGQLRCAAFVPGAKSVDLVSSNGKRVLASMQSLHAEGLFTGLLEGRKAPTYRLRVTHAAGTAVIDDPYRFGRCLDVAELQLFSEGRHEAAWQMLGAHARNIDGVDGVHFVLWAPQARRVSLLLPQCQWDGRVLLMYSHTRHGLWELFVPGLAAGTPYRFEVMGAQLDTTMLRCDPFAREIAGEGAAHSIIAGAQSRQWRDHFWQMAHGNQSAQAMPLAIHELSIGAEALLPGLRWPQLAELLLPAVKRQGFTHLLLRDIQASCDKGRQRQSALLATLPALGGGADLQAFVEQAHELELALVWDLPLASLLQAHGFDPATDFDWAAQGGALASVVLACIDYWRRELHIDGFRLRELDALLRIGNRKSGSKSGGKSAGKRKTTGDADPFAREWLGLVLQQLRERHPSLLLLADTALPLQELTLSPRRGGMGADYRSNEQHCPWQALLSPGQTGRELIKLLQQWQDGNATHQLATLSPRSGLKEVPLQLVLLACWTLPARKLFRNEWWVLSDPTWQPDQGHEFQLTFEPALDADGAALLRRLNQLYLQHPSLYELDASHEGITVVHCSETACVYERSSRHGDEAMLVLINAGETAVPLKLGLGCDRDYKLVCGVGRHELPPQLRTTGARSAGGCTVTLELPGVSGALYALQK
ncbi:MAG TPA: hypothetical protein VMH83_03345 [Candidatus Acidoferrum sp.]|nr:hypothetical protein [Candidatus Acidoferrum sp.]